MSVHSETVHHEIKCTIWFSNKYPDPVVSYKHDALAVSHWVSAKAPNVMIFCFAMCHLWWPCSWDIFTGFICSLLTAVTNAATGSSTISRQVNVYNLGIFFDQLVLLLIIVLLYERWNQKCITTYKLCFHITPYHMNTYVVLYAISC